MEEVYRIDIYVPEEHAEAVKQAIFASGAGKAGNYDCCCWQTGGQGQFRPLEGSDPFIGNKGKLEYVSEVKVETICPVGKIEEVIRALEKAHPYETPAYQYWKVNI